jgi:hypothetical protein
VAVEMPMMCESDLTKVRDRFDVPIKHVTTTRRKRKVLRPLRVASFKEMHKKLDIAAFIIFKEISFCARIQ